MNVFIVFVCIKSSRLKYSRNAVNVNDVIVLSSEDDMSSPTFVSLERNNNGFKLIRLIIDAGAKALRITLRNHLAGTTLSHVLKTDPAKTAILTNLKDKGILNQDQWSHLYPKPPGFADENDFDITLLCILLRNICGLKPSCDPIWTTKPNSAELSTEADITRIRLFRNERLGHIPNISVSPEKFENLWVEFSEPLIRIGITQADVDRLKIAPFENEETLRMEEVRKKLIEEIRSIKANVQQVNTKVENVRKNLEKVGADVECLNVDMNPSKKEAQSNSDDDALTKKLVHFTFKSEIEYHYKKFIEGTRQWVYDEFLAWFYDDTSINRAFVISAVAGMGKSIIAAALCKRFPQYVAAVHFFQYNNSRYNNAKNLLQSIAWQISQPYPAYKASLAKKLSGNLGDALNDINTEGLFSTLFTEVFEEVPETPEKMLIVLDGIDECKSDDMVGLAKLIANSFHKLPSYLRFVITTRPQKNLLDKLNELKPLFIDCNDERNLNDIKLIVHKKIESTDSHAQKLFDDLTERANGHVLVACLLCDAYNKSTHSFCINKLPRGLEDYYEDYLKRLENELEKSLGISGEKFYSFLNALAVAKASLPREFLDFALGLNSRATSNKVVKVMSSLLIRRFPISLSQILK